MDELTQVNAAPAVEGAEPQNGSSQATEPSGQPAAQPQETVPATVESTGQQASSQGETRGTPTRPSDGFRERKRIRDLESKILKMEAALNSRNGESVPPVPKMDFEDTQAFLADPIGFLKAYRADIATQVKKETMEEFERKNSTKEFQAKDQEAVELIANEGIAQEEFAEFIVENGWAEAYQLRPTETVKKAMRYYRLEHPKPDGSRVVPKKGQMVSTATGSPSVRGGLSRSDISTQLSELKEQGMKNPSLYQDEKFKAKREELSRQLSRIIKSGG